MARCARLFPQPASARHGGAGEKVEECAILLTVAAREMDAPVLLTEQYLAGPRKSMADVAATAAGCPVFEKMHSSCMEDRVVANALIALERLQIVLPGMEAHICVVQTAASLLEASYKVFVVSDATAAHPVESEEACLRRLSAAGVGIVTTKTVVFEWLGKAGTPAFRKMLPKV